jgi:hypothetical protein
VFSLGYGRVGPTEARIALIGLNAAMALGVPLHVTIAGVGVSALDLAALAVVAVMLVALAVRAARNLRELAAREPAQVTG